jgi:hypothetical protein
MRMQSCSWCNEVNELIPGEAIYCSHCGHRADVPRVQCDCVECTTRKSLTTWTGANDHRCIETCQECGGLCVGIREHLEETRESGANRHACDLRHIWEHGAGAVRRMIQ